MNHYSQINSINNSITLFKLFLLLAPAFIASVAHAQVFEEGTHYTVIESQVSSDGPVKNEVVEYFSFSCPGCYVLEPGVDALVMQPELSVQRLHMPFGGRNAKQSQKAFVLMKLLKASEHKDAIFKRIHGERNTFGSVDEIVAFFEALGYDTKAIRAHLSSFSADAMIRKMNAEAIKQKIQSVPTVIVNNRYKVNIGSLSSSSQLPAVVNFLNSKDD